LPLAPQGSKAGSIPPSSFNRVNNIVKEPSSSAAKLAGFSAALAKDSADGTDCENIVGAAMAGLLSKSLGLPPADATPDN
jgi:hypothetical protein